MSTKRKGRGEDATRRAKKRNCKPGLGSPAFDNTEVGAEQPTVDKEQLSTFVSTLFKYANPNSYISLRTFPDEGKITRPISIRAVKVASDVVAAAYEEAERAAANPRKVVFSPPVATFVGRKTAKEEDVADGLVLSVEIDKQPQTALATLIKLLGVSTLVVASGGITTTGEQKLHAYWRLKAPARDEARANLKEARQLAAALVGADKSGPPICHPMRWPGSLHRKKTPVLCKILQLNDERDIDLAAVLKKLRDAMPMPKKAPQRINNRKPVEIEEIKAALDVIPSDDYQVWWEVGCALYKELGEAGEELWYAWSRKSEKYDKKQCEQKWDECQKIPGYRVGTIFHYATKENPNWRDAQHAEQVAENSDEPITATPYVWIDPAKVPKRQWLYRPHYLRQFASATLSTGGVGKSSLLIVEALAMVTGRPLLGITPVKPLRVWYFNGEDPKEELQRRFAAATLKHGITENDIGNRLYVDSGRTMPVVLAEANRHGVKIAEPVVDQLIATVKENQIDVVIIDPFISTHHVPENDNMAIDRVTKKWSHIAEVTNCAIMLAHHTRKNQGNNANASVDDGRGASSLLAAVRVARTLNTMGEKEANVAGINESERRSYYHADIGKTNVTRPAEMADWYRFEPVDLGNTRPTDEPDTVGVVTRWEYPVFEVPEITQEVIQAAMTAVGAGGPWRFNAQSKTHPWVGIPIAEALKVDADRHKKWLAHLIDQWLAAGLLRRVKDVDPHTRKPREFIQRAT